MCRNLISIGWEGSVYDCDFNQMLDLPIRDRTGKPLKIRLAFNRAGTQSSDHHRRSLLCLYRRRGQQLRWHAGLKGKEASVKSILVAFLAAVLVTGCGKRTEEKSGAKTVIQYDAIPNYANWGGVTEAYFKKTGVRVPPDMKGSSASMAALEAEKNNPQADTVYYSGAIGYQAASKGLHQSYKPSGWKKFPII